MGKTLPRVLIIEDDKAIASMYVQRFELEGGFDVSVASNGQAGLESIAANRPDVVLLDMMMPTMSGLEALQKIRALPKGKSLQVIALTNMNDPDTSDAIKKLGVTKHIVKANTTPGEVVDVLRNLLAN